MKTSITKKLLLLFVVLGATCGAFADTTFWQNSSNGTATILCDTYLASCGGPGWIVYDDFVVSGQTRITDFTYTDFLAPDRSAATSAQSGSYLAQTRQTLSVPQRTRGRP
jgi:hypothetical protein